LNASNPREIIEEAINHRVLLRSRYILRGLSAILTAADSPVLIFEGDLVVKNSGGCMRFLQLIK
jgi:hypothetical protein